MNVLNLTQMLEFSQKGDERGHIVIVEGMKDIPFEIKRIFYIYGSDKDVVRGQHANKVSEFVLINVAGTSKVKVKDGKGNETVYSLNRPHTGVYLPRMVWKEMYDFSEDSVYNLLFVEMMFLFSYYLVGLVSFSCQEYSGSLSGYHYCCADGFFTVFDE